MAAWMAVELGDALTAAGPLAEIQDAFPAQFEARGRPAGMAVFTRTDAGHGLHCRVTAYFSPAAAGVAPPDARPCAPPPRAGLELLAGDARSWRLFGEDGPP